MASFLIVENVSLAASYPEACTACMMFLTVRVTVATAEIFFKTLTNQKFSSKPHDPRETQRFVSAISRK